MPLLVPPALPAGLMRSLSQPGLAIDGRHSCRPWRPDDAPAVRAAFDCPDIQRWHVRRMDSDDEALSWIEGWTRRWAAETDASWAIVDGRDDRPIGQVGLRVIDLPEASAHLSYWVVPTARGAGIAGRAAAALTGWAFGALRMNRLCIVHSTANAASCRVATGVGYPLEGLLRRSLRHADGWHDVHLHARLRTDAGHDPA